jgi:DegV family protein with EDD domain
MRDYVIITDSGCDLPTQMVEELGVKVVPMGLTIAGKTYRHYHDYRELSSEKFYEMVRSGEIGTTSCVSIGDVEVEMEEHLKNGFDILYLSFSSGMSGSYQAAMAAADDMKEKYPDANITVVDTLCGCIGLGMITFLAVQKKREGNSLDGVAAYVESIKLNICHFFTVDDLNYIQKTGRISHITAFVGGILGVKPVFILDNDGKVFNDKKQRGRKAAIQYLADIADKKMTNRDYVFIVHADAEADAEILKNKVLENNPNANVLVNQVGPILGNNTGPGALAIIFMGDNRYS